MKPLRHVIFLALCLVCGLVPAQDKRMSCEVLKSIDLKPLLGKDHDAPVPFGKAACRVESKGPGRLVILTVDEESPEEIKNFMAMVKKVSTQERAQEVAVTAEPALGPEAFSVREKGEQRQVELYAVKGNRSVVVRATWAVGTPISDAVFKQLQGVTQAVLAKLP
ncbi:MAG TPA: hypothetical protein VKF40_19200 [Burkholderiales bacterium]|nr:hypothetical protein [Burkholderiales bacterium]